MFLSLSLFLLISLSSPHFFLSSNFSPSQFFPPHPNFFETVFRSTMKSERVLFWFQVFKNLSFNLVLQSYFFLVEVEERERERERKQEGKERKWWEKEGWKKKKLERKRRRKVVRKPSIVVYTQMYHKVHQISFQSFFSSLPFFLSSRYFSFLFSLVIFILQFPFLLRALLSSPFLKREEKYEISDDQWFLFRFQIALYNYSFFLSLHSHLSFYFFFLSIPSFVSLSLLSQKNGRKDGRKWKRRKRTWKKMQVITFFLPSRFTFRRKVQKDFM